MELESIAEQALELNAVGAFHLLPAHVQQTLLSRQDEVLAKYSLSRDDFLADTPFIACD